MAILTLRMLSTETVMMTEIGLLLKIIFLTVLIDRGNGRKCCFMGLQWCCRRL